MYLFITVFMHVSQAQWDFFSTQSTSVKIVYNYAYMFVLQIAVIAFKKKRDGRIRDRGLNDKKCEQASEMQLYIQCAFYHLPYRSLCRCSISNVAHLLQCLICQPHNW